MHKIVIANNSTLFTNIHDFAVIRVFYGIKRTRKGLQQVHPYNCIFFKGMFIHKFIWVFKWVKNLLIFTEINQMTFESLYQTDSS